MNQINREKILDFYLSNSYVIDIFIVVCLWLINSYCAIFNLNPSPKLDLTGLISSIISTSISLAGFILAALTIIAALKANIANKSPETAKNPLELFFSKANYSQLTTVFKESIIELVIVTFGLYIIWLLSTDFSCSFLFKVLICGIAVVFLSVFRTLLVLFTIMSLEK
ncbi:hypothetical protein [Flavobacterium chungnamense]|uniref:hypothetical protein n=1 Tax=Flavobacterium chungnamense TaxID=706182 RepID=UPI0031E761B6